MASTGTGVVLGSHSLKVVQARKKGGVLKILRVANLKLDAALSEREFDAKKKERLAGLITGAGFKPGEAMLGLTGRDLIIRYAHVPPVPDWRLEMLMKFEIEEVSQQSGGEVSADWTQLDLPDSASADNTVLVALAKNTSLEPRIEVLKRGGLKLRGGCPNSIAMHHAFVSTAKIEPGETTLLMHVGSENTDIAIQQDGRLLFARNVAGGGRLFTEAIMNQFRVPFDRAEKMKAQKADVTPKGAARYEDGLAEKVSNAVMGVTGQFVSMVHSSVMFCKAQTKLKELSVDRVVLGGGGANLRGFQDYLEANLGMAVVTYDPSRAVDLSGLPPDQVEIVENDPTGLTVALGLASLAIEKEGPVAIEILPEELKKKRRFMERDVFMIGAGAVVALLIVILFMVTGWDQGSVRTEHKALQARQRSQNRALQDLAAAEADFAKAEKKWTLLKDKIRIGPCLQRALVMTTGVIRGREYREIHLLSVRTSVETRTIREDGDEPDSPYGDEEGRRVNFVKVEFRAEIRPVGRAAPAVFRDFVQDLRTATQAETGVTLKEGNLGAARKSFPFALYFAPSDIQLPD